MATNEEKPIVSKSEFLRAKKLEMAETIFKNLAVAERTEHGTNAPSSTQEEHAKRLAHFSINYADSFYAVWEEED